MNFILLVLLLSYRQLMFVILEEFLLSFIDFVDFIHMLESNQITDRIWICSFLVVFFDRYLSTFTQISPFFAGLMARLSISYRIYQSKKL
jgi:hypothetical protein